VTGLELARLFFHEAVEPIVERVMPGLRYSAGLLGDCSDVIGFDDDISRDHGWGPRCQLLLQPERLDEVRGELDAALAAGLPLHFRGYSTSFADMRMVDIESPPVEHWVDMASPEAFLRNQLGVTSAVGLAAADWIAMRGHRLLNVTAGEMFRDDLGFAETRRALGFYPDDIRLYLMAVDWMKIADEQAFPGRAGSRGDEAGSAIIAGRLAESAMRLCFLLERGYPPYSKWFGSAFRRLACSAGLVEPITRMLTARDWQERDRHWTEALAGLIAVHEREGLLEAGKYRPARCYLGRPGTGLPQFERGGPPAIVSLIDDLRLRIADPEVRALAEAIPEAG
jgi:Domain of unknown function (DUF4037)